MQPRLEPKELVGRSIQQFLATNSTILIVLEGGGYLQITPDRDWDDRPELKWTDELTYKEQHSEKMISDEEFKEHEDRAEAERQAKIKIAEERQVRMSEAEELFKLYELMKKHPAAVQTYLEPDATHVDYNGGRIRPVGEVENSKKA